MYDIIYYDKNGKCPVLDFLLSLPKKDQAKILREIDLLEEFGLSLGMPHIKQSSNNYRVFYFTLAEKKIVLLHGIKKKTQKTPKKELSIALTRKSDFIERGED